MIFSFINKTVMRLNIDYHSQYCRRFNCQTLLKWLLRAVFDSMEWLISCSPPFSQNLHERYLCHVYNVGWIFYSVGTIIDSIMFNA